MAKRMSFSLTAIMLLYFVVFMPSLANAQEAGFISKPMIAHAMGGIHGHHNTNSYEAWQANYNQGFRFFEADLILTSDDQLVARHDWDPYLYEKLVMKKQYSMIKQIAEEVDPEILGRIIPEIYTPEMYDTVMDIIPFKHVIYSIYMINDDDDTIIQFMNQHQIRVLASDPARLTGDFLKKLKENSITVYAFTVNSQTDYTALKAAGVHGFYTDFLPPC